MVALNDDLTSFFCPDQPYLIYYKTTDFMAQNLSSPVISLLRSLNLSYTNFHRNTGKYLVTGPMDSNANFYIGYLNSDGTPSFSFLYKRFYQPKVMAFDQSIFMMVGDYFENGEHISMIGVISFTEPISIKARYDSLPNSIDMKEIETNKTVRIFYTRTNGDGSFKLYKEIADLTKDFDGTNLASTSIGSN